MSSNLQVVILKKTAIRWPSLLIYDLGKRLDYS